MFEQVFVKLSGRSWWQARYNTGKIISEWDTSKDQKKSKWEEIPKIGLTGIRLLCPNGLCGEFESPTDRRLFQLKCGGVGDGEHWQSSHIIGMVRNDKGDCDCYAWEGKLVYFQDNVFNMQYQNIGRLCLEIQGLCL